MACHSHLFAIYTNLANAAFGGDRDTEVLAVGNEGIVDGKPIFLRKFFAECKFSLVEGSSSLTYPQRLVIRCTWVSTQIPGFWYPRVTTRFAVLRPTPFSFNNSSISSGTLLWYSPISILQISLIFRAFVR